ncbi:Panacea domain-containing protein [Prevotella falsenii]|uniref:Panacea domain-containing protein n=1 Tax=Prevotella falsenii TaxID=515414 RepID=UPI00055C3631|nr:type II toxin-antitoxin system antitoxin SocA domain-containing protein [Prevotella falsenii]
MRTVDIKDYATYIGITMLMKGITVSPLKLQKILYYEQAWHMVGFGRENTLFENAPEAWVNGPVYPEIFHIYKNKVPGMCEHLKYEDFDTDEKTAQKRAIELKESMQLNKEEIDLTEQVIMLYGTKTQNQLILLTHSEKPWSEKREGLMPYEYSNTSISLDTMHGYYKERYDRNRAKK